MLKILLVFTLLLTVFPVQAYSHPTETKQAGQRDQPSPPTPTISVEKDDGPSLHAEPHNHVSADVRVVSGPDKDIYERVLFWANLALAAVGIIGIGVGVCTLWYIRKQVTEMSHQRILMARTLLTIRKQTRATEDAVEAANAARASSEQTAKQQLRAYLCISKGRINFKEDSYWEPQLHIVNGGQTPAYEVRTWIDTAVREFPTWGPLKLEIPKDALQAVGIISPQGESIGLQKNPEGRRG